MRVRHSSPVAHVGCIRVIFPSQMAISQAVAEIVLQYCNSASSRAETPSCNLFDTAVTRVQRRYTHGKYLPGIHSDLHLSRREYGVEETQTQDQLDS